MKTSVPAKAISSPHTRKPRISTPTFIASPSSRSSNREDRKTKVVLRKNTDQINQSKTPIMPIVTLKLNTMSRGHRGKCQPINLSNPQCIWEQIDRLKISSVLKPLWSTKESRQSWRILMRRILKLCSTGRVRAEEISGRNSMWVLSWRIWWHYLLRILSWSRGMYSCLMS